MDARQIPVLQSFKISTPSVTVTVTADDTPLPDGAPVLSGPGNLVTVTTPQKGVEHHTTTAASLPATPRGCLSERAGIEGKVLRTVAPPPQLELGEMGELQHTGFDHYTQAPDSLQPLLLTRRPSTSTSLRRWNTYKGQQFEDTPFLGREVQFEVPIEAYIQGPYYREMEEKKQLKVYGPLPTESYVAAPRFLRRSRGSWARTCDCCA